MLSISTSRTRRVATTFAITAMTTGAVIGLAGAASAAPPDGNSACFYENSDYQPNQETGEFFCFPTGGKPIAPGVLPYTNFADEWNDLISSVQLNGDYGLRLFVDGDGQGRFVDIYTDTPNLQTLGINDQVSGVGFLAPRAG